MHSIIIKTGSMCSRVFLIKKIDPLIVAVQKNTNRDLWFRFVVNVAISVGMILLLADSSFGQAYQPGKIIPPSPTAASLGTYGNFPVNYYSGTAGITIPLYSIKTANHAVPIQLKYFSTGVRVAENASWVGLGWSLSAGGVITRTVRGLPDELWQGGYYGYFAAPALPSKYDIGSTYTTEMTIAQREYFDRIKQGVYDAEPDIFNYNFGEYSGKFVVGKTADGGVAFIDEKNNLKITLNNTSTNWTITDPLGYRFYFGTKEKALDYNYLSTTSEISADAPLSWFDLPTMPKIPTSWYLDSVVAPVGEVIKFEYEQNSQSLSLINKSESVYNKTFGDGRCEDGYPGCTISSQPHMSAVLERFSGSVQVTDDITLKRILFSLGSVEFNTVAREDIAYTGSVKPSRLSEIFVKNSTGGLVKKFTFYCDYFFSTYPSSLSNHETNRRRLKLDSVVESGSNGIPIPAYKFSYFSPSDIPYKYTKAIDHWGYYNGKTTNTRLVPAKSLPDEATYFEGADRNPDTSTANLKKGVLASISYPTGGTTEFDYELNEYNNLREEDKYMYVPQSVTASALFGDVSNLTKTFEINIIDTPVVVFQTRYKKTDPNASYYIGDYAHVYKNGNLLFDFWETNEQQPTNYSNPQTITKVLYPGNYKIDVRSITGFNTSLSASWEKRVPVSSRKGGGLRIKSIINYDNGGKVSVKKYLYTDTGVTTGKLIAPLVYDYKAYMHETQIHDLGSSCVLTCEYDHKFINRSSSSIVASGLSSDPGIIGYSKVTEYLGENGEGGKTEYYYNNEPDFASGALFPYYPTVHNPMNGKLIKSLVFNADGKLLQKVENTYQLKKTDNLEGIKIYPAFPATNPPEILDQYAIRYYNNSSRWQILSSTIEKTYSGSDSIEEVKNFYYDNPLHLNETRIETIKSNGIKVVKNVSYPQDYAAGTGFIDGMINANIISKPIESVQYQTDQSGNTNILSGQVITYTTDNKGLVDRVNQFESSLPVALSNFKFSNSDVGILPIPAIKKVFSQDSKYQNVFQVNNYSINGSLQEQQKVNDVKEVYIWGYSGQYPVAKVVGSDYNTIKGLFSQAILDSAHKYTDVQLRTELNKIRTGLINTIAKVYTYTYAPLIGITSETDTKGTTLFYEHDELGRLILIRDKDNNIVKKFAYSYSGQSGN